MRNPDLFSPLQYQVCFYTYVTAFGMSHISSGQGPHVVATVLAGCEALLDSGSVHVVGTGLGIVTNMWF